VVKGTVHLLRRPGAGFTEPTDINDRGQIVGIYGDDPAGRVHGFLLDKGRYTTIDAPGVPFTLPSGINNRGQIVGYTKSDPALPLPDAQKVHGFLLARGVEGPFTPIDVSGAPRAIANGINDQGEIIGVYENPAATPGPQGSPMQPPMMMMSGR
jgi:uncharacterized membrane protein